jgi:hypothetical protein
MRGAEGGRGCEVSAVSGNEYSCTHGAQIDFGYLTPFNLWSQQIQNIEVIKGGKAGDCFIPRNPIGLMTSEMDIFL